jgi:CrcB protein
VPVAAGDVRILAAICLGGGLGSLARYGIERALPAGSGIPTGTLLINLSGAFLLGLLVAVVAARLVGSPRPWAPLVRPALGTGVLGGYTTFSTAMVEAHDRSIGVAAGYLALSLVAGIALAWAGIALGERLAGRPPLPHGGQPVDPDLP